MVGSAREVKPVGDFVFQKNNDPKYVGKQREKVAQA